MMNQLITRFPDQLREAISIGKSASIKPLTKPVAHVYVAGLGGSGIGADFVAQFIRAECKVPYLVGKGYHIPAYVGDQSLAIASSYSGNTEETLMSFGQMLNSGARIMCISSGGKLIELAKQNDFDYVQVPGDWPSPRACLGFSVVAQLCVLEKLGLTSAKSIGDVERSIVLIENESASIKAEAESVASQLHNKIPVIYSTDRFPPVVLRFRQQVNENSKSLCWHGIIPEMNHNELVGWRDKNDDLAVIYFRSQGDFERNARRIDINKTIINKYTDTIIDVFAKGESLIEQSMYLVHLGDWISWYLSQLRGVDSIEVDVIDYLKGELAKVAAD